MDINNKILKFSMVFLVVLLGARPVFSCSVPVFQQAMERWRQSSYDGVLFYRGSLNQEEQETFASLQEMMRKDNSVLNLRIEKLDVDSKSDQYEQLLQGVKPDKLPALALWYPREKGNRDPFWVRPLQSQVLEKIVESGKRREMASHLVEGCPVVWLLVYPSGEKNKEATLNSLREKISKSVTSMKQNPRFKPIIENGDSEVSFPVVTISADNPEESVLLSMITGFKEGSSVNKPVVLPIYGRGRALTTVTTDELDEDLIYNIMSFLLGPCSCQTKAANPGTDMLVKANWEKASDSFSQESPSMLTSVRPDSGSANTSSTLTAENDSIIDLTTDQHSSFFNTKIVSSVGGIIGILVVIMGVLTWIVLKRK